MTAKRHRDLALPAARVPAGRLPEDPRERDQLLQDYVAERVPEAIQDADGWAIRLRTPPRADYYIDPRLQEGLAWWSQFSKPVLIRDIPYARWRRRGVQVSLSDAWTLSSWSQLLAAGLNPDWPLLVLHADDHEDLMSPRLVTRSGTLVDLISGKSVHAAKPATIDAALRSGAIGMGSFIVPMLAARHDIQVRHLRTSASHTRAAGRYDLVLTHEPDRLLAPGEPRPSALVARPGEPRQDDGTIVGSYTLTADLGEWVGDLPDRATLLLHVDCDYFNNRYDGDSDWRSRSRIHDPSEKQLCRSIAEFCEALRALNGRINDLTIALSPGFFPAEYWQGAVDALLQVVRVRRSRPKPTAAHSTAVKLQTGKGSPGRGGDPGGQFWHIYDGDRRAGSVWINQAPDDDLGTHASLSIELNEASRGKGIGQQAYRLAAEASCQDEIWLHMRRSNIASRKAAEYAGFTVINMPHRRQLIMRWQRQVAAELPQRPRT